MVAAPGLDARYWQRLSSHAERPPHVATSVTHLRDNDAAFQARLDLIAQAKTSIACTLYHMEADGYSERFLDALIAASKRGVFVALSLDFLAENATLLSAGRQASHALQAKLQALADSGSFVSWFATPKEQLKKFGQGNHFKALVVDGDKAILGGRNMGSSYFKRWTDFDCRLEGPIVTDIGHAALDVLQRSNPNNRFSHMGSKAAQRAAYDTTLDIIREQLDTAAPRLQADAERRAAAGEDLARFQLVFHDPMRAASADNAVTDALVDTYRSAQQEVLATSNYVNPVQEIRAAAVQASQRGVETLFASTSAEASSTSSLPALNAAIALEALFSAGARCCETKRQEHGKLYVADRRVAAFGSYNLEHPAHDRLVEGLLFTDDQRTVDVVHDAIMDTVDTRSRPFEPREHEETGFFGRLRGRFRRFLARVIEPFA